MIPEQKPSQSNLSKARSLLAAVILILIVPIFSINIVYAIIIDNGFAEPNSSILTMGLAADMLSWILGLMATISLPIFLAGVYKFFKGKKKEEIKILSFVFKSIFSFISSAVFIFLYFIFLLMIISKISIFYNSNNFNIAGWILLASLYIIGIYGFAKWQLETLKFNFFIILAIFLFNIAMIIYALTIAVTDGPMI